MTLKEARAARRAKSGLRRRKTGIQRTVRSSLTAAVIGEPAFSTVASRLLEPSVTRAATPTPATSVAQTSETTTIFGCVVRSAVKSEKLFITPSPGSHPVSRDDPEKGSRGIMVGPRGVG